MKHWEFWNALRDVTQRDASLDVPDHVIVKADQIFQPRRRHGSLLQLRPTLAGMMRDSEPGTAIYESESGQFVELSQTVTDGGMALTGFSSAGESGTVRMFAEDLAFEASIIDGEFSFEALPDGCYTMSLDQEGAHFWIQDLLLRNSD